MDLHTHSLASSPITRREALKRAAAFLGVAISPSLFSNVLRAQSAAGSPRFLSDEQLAIAGALAERILPRTDTPGALDVGVPFFIDLMYGEFMTVEEQEGLFATLAAFEAAAMNAHQLGFAQLTPEQQDALLRATAESPADREHFVRIRELTVVGYFTSETIGREVLHFDPIPASYDGCVPLDEVGNVSWTSK